MLPIFGLMFFISFYSFYFKEGVRFWHIRANSGHLTFGSSAFILFNKVYTFYGKQFCFFYHSDFVRGDVHVKGRRHIVMATNSQLVNLASADRWYIHETSRLVRHPFTHLLSINCYVKKGKVIKFLPFCFVLMSGKKSKDYKEVLRVIKSLVGDSVSLSEITLDYDKALWKSVSQVFQGVLLKGYVHQWKHSVWAKIAKFDLTWAYLKEEKVHSVLSKLMSLAYLPAEVIPATFHELKALTDSGKVIKVGTRICGCCFIWFIHSIYMYV